GLGSRRRWVNGPRCGAGRSSTGRRGDAPSAATSPMSRPTIPNDAAPEPGWRRRGRHDPQATARGGGPDGEESGPHGLVPRVPRPWSAATGRAAPAVPARAAARDTATFRAPPAPSGAARPDASAFEPRTDEWD